MKIRCIFFYVLLFLYAGNNFSQTIEHNCGQHILLKKLLSDSTFKSRYEKEQNLLSQIDTINYSNNTKVIYKIPIVFHLIHNNGIEKIDRDQMLDALEILNRDMRAQNPDTATVDSLFIGIIADTEIEFVLATKAPNGDCFSGITVTETPYSYNLGNIGGNDQVDAVMMYNDVYQGNWPGDEYLNVFICGAVGTGIAGYTYYPSNFFGNSMNNGIWLRYDYCGSFGTSSPYKSRVFAHEVGHWLNLPHTWGSTNDPGLASNCNTDDGVIDTPNTIGSQSCNYNETTCGPKSNVENYMEYSGCRKMFTLGQKSRMRTAIISSIGGRDNLTTTANHISTGIEGSPPFCQTNFYADRYVTCSGDSIHFKDFSYHNPIAWNWYFEGGQPDTAFLENPYTVYQHPGLFDVTLSSSGDSSTYLNNIKSDLVTVLDYDGKQLPYFEGFENTTIDKPEWMTDGTNWTITDETSYNGSYCLKLSNRGLQPGSINILESTTFDLSDSLKAFFSFKYAFAKKSNNNTDQLKILASNDCGKTWSVRKLISVNTLSTAATQFTFTPTFSEWKEATITSIIGPYCVSNFRFKFEFTSGGGNNFFIDNINISLENAADIYEQTSNGLLIYPNPTKDKLNIVSQSNNIDRVLISDIAGKIVLDKSIGSVYKTTINTYSLSNGYYTLTVLQKGLKKTLRFIKQ